MQDRYRQLDEDLLRRTAGPYIGVIYGSRVMSAAGPIKPNKRTLVGGA